MTKDVQSIEKKLSGLNIPEPRGRIVVYTVCVNGYDRPKQIIKETGIDYICVTDCAAPLPYPWKKVFLDARGWDPRVLARMTKVLTHAFLGAYEASVYLDCSVVVLRPLKSIPWLHCENHFILFRHPRRSCLYEEAAACLLAKKVDWRTLHGQIMRYRQAGMPTDYGLAATGFLFRRHNERGIRTLSRFWAQEILGGSARDQVSLPYVLWRVGVRPKMVDENIFWNRWLVPMPHARAGLVEKIKWHGKAVWYFRLRYIDVLAAACRG